MKSLLKYELATAILSTTLLFGQAAFAEPPEEILGTWNGQTSGTTVITDIRVTVADQQPHNPGQVSECRSITGDMSVETRTGPLDGSMTGFYCPKTDAFAYILYTTEDRVTRQVYRGNISDDGNSMVGTFLYMSGDWGEYDFSASKTP
jgi:hypothetical protein